MSSSLEDLCKQLHISGVHTYFLESGPHQEEMESFLISSLQAELDIRLLNRQMRALRLAGFPTRKRFEDLVPDGLPEDGRRYLPELKSLSFIGEKRNVLLIGNSGTGKTHLAIAAGVRACEQNYRVVFRTAASLVNEMIEATYNIQLWISHC